ncbi:unnamed protein product, partial [Effrenium voratum]
MPWRWILAPALVRGFFVPLDAPSIQALLHRFTLLELPTASCPGEDDGSWHPHCAFGLADIVECEYTGYQYSMEWYFIEMLRDNLQYLADPEEAEFVYFPHCVSQLYFALKDTHNLTHWQAIERAELQYLVPMLRWAHRSPLHAKFGGRNFWTVFSMDLGRQDFPRSGAWLQRWSVGSLTGSPTWMADNRMLLNTSQMNDVVDCWELDTAPVVFANEMFPARTFRAQDTVISIPSRFSPHPRSRRFGGRPVLAFFAGSPNSCARERILALLSNEPGFDVSTSFATGNEEYRERMWRARFCFVLRGSSHTNNVRLYDVMAHGCVPVIVSDDFQPPLDRLLPWKELAIFLPTSSIPRLAHILRQVTEKQRWHYFRNIAIGRPEGAKGYPEDFEAAKAFPTHLDRESLWSGLSASRVFEWHDSIFWILFYADVAAKLRARVKAAADTPLPARPQQGLLLAALRWLLDLHFRRDRRMPVVLDCGGDVQQQDALGGMGCCGLRWLHIRGLPGLPEPEAMESCRPACCPQSPEVLLKVGRRCHPHRVWELVEKYSPRVLWLSGP